MAMVTSEDQNRAPRSSNRGRRWESLVLCQKTPGQLNGDQIGNRDRWSVVTRATQPRDLGMARQRGLSAARLRRAVASRVYLPACSVAVVAATLIGIGWSRHWGGVGFAGSVTSLRVVLVGPLAIAIIGVILVVERVRPAQRRPLIARGHRHDVLFTILNVLLVAPLVTALTLSFVDITRQALPWFVLPKMPVVPRWAAIVVIFVAMDGCNWFVHLANHRIRMLWRFHELHHSQEDLNVLTVFRTHPLIHVSYLFAVVPGIVLLANGAASTTLLVIYGGIVGFAHSNTNLGFGPLGRIFVSPNFHRIHHRVDEAQDVNLGFALTIWDQLFHRAVFPTPETIRADTGLRGRPLAVEQDGPRSRHLSIFAAQLLGPFRPLDETGTIPSIRDASQPSLRHGGRAVEINTEMQIYGQSFTEEAEQESDKSYDSTGNRVDLVTTAS
jgi:sterol desaturase/sphingolipid hydroxylase (fatty acid hydroxylase superfamily)